MKELLRTASKKADIKKQLATPAFTSLPISLPSEAYVFHRAIVKIRDYLKIREMLLTSNNNTCRNQYLTFS